MKELKKYPLTGADREKIVEQDRKGDGYVVHRVHKAKFGQNDIMGCIDILSYDQDKIVMDQVSTVHHISDKIKEIERMLIHPPATTAIMVCVHGIDGYRQGNEITLTRYVMRRWHSSGRWSMDELIQKGDERHIAVSKFTANKKVIQ